MHDEAREILNQVAAGTISPADAAHRLEQVGSGPVASAPIPVAGALVGVRVRSTFGRIVVIGDPQVDQVVAEGPHRARVEGAVMVIDADHDFGADFSFSAPPAGRWWESFLPPTLTVRANPGLELWVNADAGSVNIRDMKGRVHADVQAGALAVEGFAAGVELTASAGSIRAGGRLVEGDSRVRCEMGSVRISLAADSDVRVGAVTQMGRLSFEPTDEAEARPPWGTRGERVYGAGTASLEIEAQMGAISVGLTR